MDVTFGRETVTLDKAESIYESDRFVSLHTRGQLTKRDLYSRL